MADVEDSAAAGSVAEPPRSRAPSPRRGRAYDSHMNLVLGDVLETIYVVDDDENDEEIRTVTKKSEMLFVRGDSVVLVSPHNSS
ncbi:Sm-like ribonucleoprotein [Apiospora hydei]|uniref:Sm-like ribonucleoprotein n=1 Tax=Apiospora hydei TaxID=1337664 RepID=A0ABR1UQA4_9PEZI